MGLCPECNRKGETIIHIRTAIETEATETEGKICDRCGKEY